MLASWVSYNRYWRPAVPRFHINAGSNPRLVTSMAFFRLRYICSLNPSGTTTPRKRFLSSAKYAPAVRNVYESRNTRSMSGHVRPGNQVTKKVCSSEEQDTYRPGVVSAATQRDMVSEQATIFRNMSVGILQVPVPGRRNSLVAD